VNEDYSFETLIQEIARYLEAVELFRTAGYEPAWRPEIQTGESSLARMLAAYNQPAPQPAT
jgi:hypothetical protein